MVNDYSISEGSQTRAANAQLSGCSFDEDEEDYEENLDRIPDYFEKNSEYFTSFSEHLCRIIKEKGVTGVVNQKNYLCGLLKETALHSGEKSISEGTIGNWLKGRGRPADDQEGREKVYRLCFALGFDDRKTSEFFIKAYWTRPFNFRKMSECVYWFCLKNRLSYQDAVRIQNAVKPTPLNDADLPNISTVQIKSEVYDCQTEAELIRCLASHQDSLDQANRTAREELIKLLDECKQAANELRNKEMSISMISNYLERKAELDAKRNAGKDVKKNTKDDNAGEITSDEQLLREIYGFNAREQHGGKLTYEGYAFQFPDYVARNMLQFSQLQAIRDTKKAMSDDAVRKALILLGFYSFFARLRVAHSDSKSKAEKYIKEYIAEENDILNRCGFGVLYVRNPYDWMFLHCAKTLEEGINPLQELQAFTMDFYNPNK